MCENRGHIRVLALSMCQNFPGPREDALLSLCSRLVPAAAISLEHRCRHPHFKDDDATEELGKEKCPSERQSPEPEDHGSLLLSSASPFTSAPFSGVVKV